MLSSSSLSYTSGAIHQSCKGSSIISFKPKSAIDTLESEYLIRFAILLAAVITATLVVYWPGLTGPLLFDDYTNLSPLGEDGGVSSWSTFQKFVFGNASGPSGRPVAMLSFLIDAQNWPPHIASFKYTNILIHALTGLLLCWFAYTLFQVLGLSSQRSAVLALLAAAVWLLHPLNGSTTLYVVQRMTQLMTLFGLASLLCYLKGRQLIVEETKKGLLLLCVSLFPFALLSVLSKENGALILLLVIVMELSVFQAAAKNTRFKTWYTVAVLAPLAVLGIYLLFTLSSSLAGYEYRNFSLSERLLTEARILLTYLSKIFFPFAASTGLFHDDLQISKSLFDPWTTVASILSLCALAGAGLYWRKQQPMLFFGIAWFLAMHLLESTYLPLELYFEHRNYMSMIGPIISLCWYFHKLLVSSQASYWKRIAIGVAVVIVVGTGLLSWQQARLWGHTGNLYANWAQVQPESSRAQIIYADFLSLNGDAEAGMQRLRKAHEIYPQEITILLHMWNNACEYELQAPYSLEEISEMDGLEYYQNDIGFHLTKLLENLVLDKCTFPEPPILLALFETVNDLSLADDRRASFHFLYSDLFVHYRQLNPALIQLRQAFDLNASPQIPIRQALLSASAGNNDDALVFLERAKLADKQQSLLLPSYTAEIARIEADINSRISSSL